MEEHSYVIPTAVYISQTYPDRHTLILGDSRVTLPQYTATHHHNPSMKFDVIFIDGSHDYEVVKSDLENCMTVAHEHTLVIMDDTVYQEGWKTSWTIGPTLAWLEGIADGKIIELGRSEYMLGRGISWGKYVVSVS